MSDSLKHTSDSLKQGALRQVADYEKRFSSLNSLYDDLFVDLIRTQFSAKEAKQTATDFFGSDSVSFAGIDGTVYSKPMFDMVIFFGGAYAAKGKITFSETDTPHVEYEEKNLQQGAGISSVVPIYVNEIPEVDHKLSATEHPENLDTNKQFTDESIADNSIIANSLMTLSEYYLAYKLATDQNQAIKIILLDRCLSSERASLLYDTGKTDLWKTKSTIMGLNIDSEEIDENDLTIGRHHICNTSSFLPPPRADYLRHAIINLSTLRGRITVKETSDYFNIKDQKRSKRVENTFRSLVRRGILTKTYDTYSMSPKYASSSERLKRLTIKLANSIFFGNPEDPDSTAPMRIQKDGKENWLTTLDISFLTLFTFQMLIEECWKRNILLVGITKDTAARDLKRQLIPIMRNEKLLRESIQLSVLQDLPNTDRMILQSTSIFNPEKVKPPWTLIEYDSAFKTMLIDLQHTSGYVSGAIKNKISLEKTFLKTYIQLSQAKTDPLLRSNVLLTERLVYPKYDYNPRSTITLRNELTDGTTEPVEALLFQNKIVPNPLQNLVFETLVAMAPSNIPEAFGHNKALFIADKIAKWNYSQSKSIVDTTATWILNNHKLRKFIFYMSTFRERRTSFEATRREKL